MLASKSTSLGRWDRIGLVALLLATVLVGGITVMRSAKTVNRRGDFGVYARAAWAVRTGANLREAQCDHGWHYVYPPTLAVLMVPLAEPPIGQRDALYLPYGISVALWYTLSVGLLAVAVHLLANALEKAIGRQGRIGDRAWWRIRILPVLACLPVVGETLTRGQVNFLVLLGICGFIAALISGHAYKAGAYLAGAICVKVIPAFLLLAPMLRRDLRTLAGCTAGLIVLGVLIPICGLGIQGTWADYGEFAQSVLGPGVGMGHGAQSRVDDELTNITCGHSQSPMGVMHTWIHPERTRRPEQIAPWTRRMHWLIGGSLTLLTLLAGRDLWRAGANRAAPRVSSIRLTLVIGLLVIDMMMLSPMCHSHYLCLAIPTFMALMAWDWQNREDDGISRGLAGLMAVFLVANTIPMLPGLLLLDDGGMAGIALLLVWFAGAAALFESRRVSESNESTAGINKSLRGPHLPGTHASPRTSLSTSSET